jgi:hypothetical protein
MSRAEELAAAASAVEGVPVERRPEFLQNRDSLRAKFLGRKPKRVLVDVKSEDGIPYQLEVVQPTVERTLAMSEQQADGQTPKDRMVSLVIDHTYIPGTNDKLFGPEDADVIKGLPNGGEFSALMNKLIELTNIAETVEMAAKNLKATPSSSSSST